MEEYYQYLKEYTENEPELQTMCKCENIVNYKGIHICKDCGVEKDTILDEAEWRYYGAEDSKNSDPTRCGMPINTLLPQSSVGTVVSFSHQTNNCETRKIRNYSSWNGMPYKERSSNIVFNEITNVCKRANLPNCIIQESKRLYNDIYNFDKTITNKEKNIKRGNNKKGLIAATVYQACIEKGVPRSHDEIAEIFCMYTKPVNPVHLCLEAIVSSIVEKGDLQEKGNNSELYKKNIKKQEKAHIKLNTKIVTNGEKQFRNIYKSIYKNKKILKKKPTKPIDFIDRFISQMNLPDKVCELSKIISLKSCEHKLTYQNTPQSISVACIYLSCKHLNIPCNKKKLSEVCNISEVTINKCFKKLNDNLDKLI